MSADHAVLPTYRQLDEAKPHPDDAAPSSRCRSLEGQTTMIFLLLIIVIFVGMGVFLLSLAKQVSQSDYLDLYTHNLLSALLKTDTGLTEPSCKTTADLLACSFLSPTHLCGTQDCLTLADQRVSRDIADFSSIREGFRFLLAVEPEGFASIQGGQLRTVEVGDASLKTARTEKIVATQRIQKILGGSPYLLTVRLIISKKA